MSVQNEVNLFIPSQASLGDMIRQGIEEYTKDIYDIMVKAQKQDINKQLFDAIGDRISQIQVNYFKHQKSEQIFLQDAKQIAF